jgi:hypothetical protein
MTETTSIPTALTCYVHPDRETSLRCKRCERPICPSCAVRTPTGYMCKDCVREHQKTFDTTVWADYVIGFVIAGLLSLLASLLAGLISGIGFFGWFIIIAGAPTAAVAIAEAVRFGTRRHRSRPLFITVAVGVVIGALPAILFQLFSFNVFGLIFEVIYLVIAVPLIYTRLSGIQLFK